MAVTLSCSFGKQISSLLIRSNLRRNLLMRMSSVEAKEIAIEPGPPSPVPTETRKVSERIEALVDQITNLSLLEVSDLNYALRKRLNIPETIAMPVGMVTNTPRIVPEEEENSSIQKEKPQKISFRVMLNSFDETKKVPLIKEIRNVIPGLNLVQAKKFVDSIPAVIKQDIGKGEADELKAMLEKVGGVCEIE
ncbi:unnamed protein product [Dracunculus medinensis]|uniref:39S ribosomal protein L12, mitochondrial n=1 Tax=Dracunculus medinensis TaxID=318479 RepID=A0A0N4UIN3_DRAME|nr:unnamed protein product [Dracunculus medinensis]